MSYEISGTIVNEHNAPIEGVEVTITGHDSEYTDSSGEWSATVEGEVSVTPETFGWVFTPISRTVSSPASDLDFEGRNMTRHEYVEGPFFGVEDIGWSYEISGTVTDNDGNPLQGVKVNFDWPGWGHCPLTPEYTDSDGNFVKTHCYGNDVKIWCDDKETAWPGPTKPYHIFAPEYHTVSEADSEVNFQSTTETHEWEEEEPTETLEPTFGVVDIEWYEIQPEPMEPEEILEPTFGVEDIEWQEILDVEEEVTETLGGATFGVEDIQWQFIVTAPPYEVTGVIRDVQHNPIVGVKVTAIRVADNHSYPSVHTNAAGEYLIQNIHHECQIVAAKENWEFTPGAHLVDYYESGINFEGLPVGFEEPMLPEVVGYSIYGIGIDFQVLNNYDNKVGNLGPTHNIDIIFPDKAREPSQKLYGIGIDFQVINTYQTGILRRDK